ncbi:hypothetical protein [Parasedimentitalea huanghaiensis]|uniref:Uncharacterized protein n=1 Tax=Parasedimentitalea huanghaiensis TaxID=2682100 RepID=A0A6L6WP57_9RHOB|nr:hypothetical protein [Zongyanglinia huanghaiensis]MVO18455.1 hypothetical protein [Zongyanglinia huanghaiensis]
MAQSKFNRPLGFEGVQTDPEESYRAGYQHGTREMLRFLEASNTPGLDRVKSWINNDLAAWRHDVQAEPIPPKLSS